MSKSKPLETNTTMLNQDLTEMSLQNLLPKTNHGFSTQIKSGKDLATQKPSDEKFVSKNNHNLKNNERF